MATSLNEGLQKVLPVAQEVLDKTSVGMSAEINIPSKLAKSIDDGNYKEVADFFAGNLNQDIQLGFACTIRKVKHDTSLTGLFSGSRTIRVSVSFAEGLGAKKHDQIKPPFGHRACPVFYLVFTRLS